MGKSYVIMKEHSLKDGFYPNIARTVDDFEESFFYILSEQLIGFGTDDFNLSKLDGMIRSIPIEGSWDTYEIVLASQKDSKNQTLIDFLTIFDNSLL